MENEAEIVRRMRNVVAYQGIKNSLIEWMNSPQWEEIPGFMHIRGECVTRYISTKTHTKILKFVANGAVSGEITCQ